jgi:MFS family permease
MAGQGASITFLLRALHYRNYRLFFGGQGISLIGTWMQQIAMSWLVYRLTGSAFLLGLIGFSGQLPTFVFSPLAGVFADRFDRRRVLMLTQTLSMVQATILAILTFTGYVAVWHLIVLSTFIGFVNALDIPVRQSFVIDLVENREDLGNAIALNSVMFNGARLVQERTRQ